MFSVSDADEVKSSSITLL